MRWKYFLLIICLTSACTSPAGKISAMMKDPDNALLQEKKLEGRIYRLQYLPVPPENGDPNKITLRMNIFAEQGTEKMETSTPVFSYGVDTLFSLEGLSGTTLPVHAARVANGNLSGIEYLVIFERTQDTKFTFRDVLFTNKLVEFKLNPEAMKKMDDLNTKTK